MCRSLTRSDAECAEAPFEGGNAPLEYSIGWVAYSRISKTLHLQVKQRGAMFGTVERIGGCLIYWDGYSLGRGIGIVSAMYRDGLDFVGDDCGIFRRRSSRLISHKGNSEDVAPRRACCRFSGSCREVPRSSSA